MATLTRPEIGCWYTGNDFPDIFEVVAIDENAKAVEIQFFDGAIEEVELSLWHASNIQEIPAPEDWSGAYEMEKEDYRDYTDTAYQPEQWSNPVDTIEAEDFDWQEHHIR